ncbi:uncharacterized protein Z520_05594 [Fonsecaea multimorphosa CBS 102226]|uniref:Asl1-like glycosyl hydrolase catalytic domain-containing protein n=1 Tax=Fonsecaea multimorphosa CBS 102226 TaxID=1442371 RepID=A0A0D2KNK3_9EURO|nr:uncharacterized protein Z520_05594 [Fonsecaea multimorphosa CBS 102226]KIX98293.1 hypothetical protein Z520_05594 [Fonsecaea multimorphosa CBS 102226]OAL24942.1 hypothetical protein AYO22_05278 [Fonsecaea multimorphosa]
MVAKFLSVALFASAVLAHPKRHERFHYGTGSGTGGGWAMPTGGVFPMNGTAHTKGSDSGASSSVESSPVVATAVKTVTVQPIPLESSSPDTATGFSSAPEVAAVASNTASPDTDVAPTDAVLSSCYVLTSTITATSVQYVTVTATAAVGGSGESGPNFGGPSGSAPSGAAGQFFGASSSSTAFAPSEGPGGFYGGSPSPSPSSSSSSTTTTSGAGGFPVGAVSSSWTTASAPGGGPGEFFPGSSSATPLSSATSSAVGGLSPSSSISIAGTPTAGEFFPGPGENTGVPSFGGSSSVSFPSVASQGVPSSIIPTTFATVTGGAPASSPAASASSASSPASSPSSSPSTGSSGKRGLSYNDASLTDAFAGKGMTWAYNWAASPGGQVVSGAEYVPLLWGQDSISGWSSAVQSAIASGSKHALGFNEPDLDTQSNIDPTTAAQLYIANMNPLSGQVQLGSPAITNGAGTSPLMGIDWLNAFFEACNGECKVDFVAFHWYDSASNMAYFQSHVNDVIAAAKANGVGKVWLTEFGASGDDSDVANFLTQAMAFLDSTDAVERYAYFMCSDGILVDGTSISSPVGAAYAA